MNNRNLLIVALLLVGILLVTSSAFVVKETERAVLLRFGEVVRSDYEPGLYFKVPLVHTLRKFDARVQTVDSNPVRMLNSENKFMVVDSYAKYRIFNAKRFYVATRGNERNAVRLLAEQINDRLRDQFGVRNLHEVVSGQRDELMAEITKNLNGVAQDRFGLEVIDVRVKRIDLPPEVSESVFQRMRAGRELEARDHRAKGQEAAERIRSNADRQVVEIESEAQRKAEELRGAGDAEAARIYAGAFTRDPEFYRFTRSLNAYEKSFSDRGDMLVIDPDSEFFRYLKDSEGAQEEE
ncbi:protease modulator HflC [Microbulbifer halophilus]|uniref:Protein HflC n=1 Tax=Microbulbifer halophilus TaxID=453963 RepID=A0ABW5EAZ7_9GAMM|nr:protease modulator HflC [Microbulbifer halophilus]MCW8126707.1 protease modulator HflC [Microbulbifer halophilus]